VGTTKFNLISWDLSGETEENKDGFSQDSRSSDEALNPGTSEYENAGRPIDREVPRVPSEELS